MVKMKKAFQAFSVRFCCKVLDELCAAVISMLYWFGSMSSNSFTQYFPGLRWYIGQRQNFPHAALPSARRSTLFSCRFFWLTFRVRMRSQVSFSLSTPLHLYGIQLRAFLCIFSSCIRRVWPHHFQRAILIFSTTLCWPVVSLSSSSLTWSHHYIFIILLRQYLSKFGLFVPDFIWPFHDSQAWRSTDLTMTLNNFSFVPRDILSSFHTFSM